MIDLIDGSPPLHGVSTDGTSKPCERDRYPLGMGRVAGGSFEEALLNHLIPTRIGITAAPSRAIIKTILLFATQPIPHATKVSPMKSNIIVNTIKRIRRTLFVLLEIPVFL